MGSLHCSAWPRVKKLNYLQTQPTDFQNLPLNDSLIVPTQQFTRYPSLIEAVIEATPADHPDMPVLKKAMTNYSYIGRRSNERQLIAKSPKELRSMKLTANITDQMTQFFIDCMLFNWPIRAEIFYETRRR